jgi:integration host factor subunit alpha
MALTKADIASALSDKIGLSRYKSKELVELFFSVIKEALAESEEVKLSGFGTFKVREKGERPGRNPRTGEPYKITARKVVLFRASNKLKSQVAGLLGDDFEEIEEFDEMEEA